MPKATLLAFTLSAGAEATSCSAKLLDPPFAVADRVAVCAVETDATVDVKLALVAPEATVTLAGRVTEVLLLVRLTAWPPVGAAAFRVTVQASEPAPVIEPLAQETVLTTALPVPLRLTTAVPFVVDVLEMVSWPVDVPATVGTNWMVNAAVWPGVRVVGKVIPDIVNPEPVSAAEFTTTATLPVEDRVTVCVEEELMATLPITTLLVLMLSVGTAATSCTAKLALPPFALAPRVAVCAVETEAAVAVKLALVAPAATVTVEGTVTAAFPLVRLTAWPPVGAAALRVTVQESVPAPVIDAFEQATALGTLEPVPLRETVAIPFALELLAMLNWPVAEPAALGSN